MKTTLLHRLLLVALVAAFSATASAQVTLYTTRSAFNAVTTSPSIITFEGIAPGGSATAYNDAVGVTLSGVQFVGTSSLGTAGELFIESASLDPARNWGTGDNLVGDRFGYYQTTGTPVGKITATLPSNTYAIGTDFMLAFTNGTRPASPVRFTVYVGSTGYDFDLISGADTTAFAGFVSTAPITSVEYRTMGINGLGSAYGALDNFTTATSAVPEPATTAAILGAVVLGGTILRRRAMRKLSQ